MIMTILAAVSTVFVIGVVVLLPVAFVLFCSSIVLAALTDYKAQKEWEKQQATVAKNN